MAPMFSTLRFSEGRTPAKRKESRCTRALACAQDLGPAGSGRWVWYPSLPSIPSWGGDEGALKADARAISLLESSWGGGHDISLLLVTLFYSFLALL